MAKYVYPAIFTPEASGGYSIHFPDIENCFTCGDSISDSLEMAADALCLMLYSMEQDGKEIPSVSDIKTIQTTGKAFVNLISCDTIEYRKFFDSKAVKKTLSIPSWLNDMGERRGLNFSAALQRGLKEELNID